MKVKSQTYALLIGALLGTAGIVTAQASSTIITFSVDMATNIANSTFIPGTDTVAARGSFNGFGTLNLVLDGTTASVYTNTVNDTTDANGGKLEYKFYDSNGAVPSGGWENPAHGGNNRNAHLPSTSGASLVLPTAFFSDAGAPVTNLVSFQVNMAQQISLGTFTPGTSQVYARGTMNGYGTPAEALLTNDPSIVVITSGGLHTSNVYTGIIQVPDSPGASELMKFYIDTGGNWENVALVNQGSGSGDRFFKNVAQTLPIVDFGDQPYAPLCVVTFSVDMSAQAYASNWNSGDSVFLSNIGGGIPMTNNPTASNTNIYYQTFTYGQGSFWKYKFYYTNSSGTVYETPMPPTAPPFGDRFLTVPSVASTNLPTVYFSDVSTNDLLSANILVTFTVDMTGATATNQDGSAGSPFNPDSDIVFISGAWIGWANNTWNPIALQNYQLVNSPLGSSTYVGQFTVQGGWVFNMAYKYSINGLDNEAVDGPNHVRYIRTTATGAYSFPVDTFGNLYNEPAFGQLAVGSASGGKVPVNWLGLPNVQLQTRTNLASGSWVSHPETAGTVWSAGINSANGLISVTNWPASGNLFYRLIQQ
jgi:hypothetical protein